MTHANEIEIGFKFHILGLTLTILGMAFIVFASFQFGILVGQSPEIPEKITSSLSNWGIKRFCSPVNSGRGTAEKTQKQDEINYSFYDILGGKEFPKFPSKKFTGKE